MKLEIYSTLGEDYFPKFGTEMSAGFDLYTPVDINLNTYDGVTSQMIDTGIILKTIREDGSEIINNANKLAYLLMPRSSMGKQGIRFANTVGVIDEDYCGPEDTIKVMLTLDTSVNRVVSYPAGTRFAQILIVPILNPSIEMKVGRPEGPSRGGIGSTGVK